MVGGWVWEGVLWPRLTAGSGAKPSLIIVTAADLNQVRVSPFSVGVRYVTIAVMPPA